jgi:membrane protease subunit (stomatin/prohibitin family)
MFMSRIGYAVSAVVLAGTLSLGVTFAQSPAPATAPAPAASDKAAAKQKKADCTKQAKEQKMRGAARTKFMKECTSKK